MEQITRELSKSMSERLEEQRGLVKGIFPEEEKSRFNSIDGKIDLLQAVLDAESINKDSTYILQSLGIVLGDALSQRLGLAWIEVEDEYGIDPALRYEGTSIVLFPLTMISKRVEMGEQVSVSELFEGICNGVNELLLDPDIE